MVYFDVFWARLMFIFCKKKTENRTPIVSLESRWTDKNEIFPLKTKKNSTFICKQRAIIRQTLQIWRTDTN